MGRDAGMPDLCGQVRAVIVHFDVDAFYASVAQRNRPELRGKPVVVAGESRRAVVLTASYEARPYGVRSAIPLYQARERCPQLIVTPPDFPAYRAISQQIFEILRAGTTAFQSVSLDEAYVALAECAPSEAHAFAERARARVRAETGLAISAGISARKMTAKIASDDAKPDGVKLIEPGTEAAYLAPLPIGRLSGVGPKTQERLVAAGIATIGALATLDDDALFRLFGRTGRAMRDLARGCDARGVESERETRSVSTERTLERDLRDPAALLALVDEAAREVARRLREHGLRAQTIGVKCKLADFRIRGRQSTLREPTDDGEAIVQAARSAFLRLSLGDTSVRLVGVRAATLTGGMLRQLSMLD